MSTEVVVAKLPGCDIHAAKGETVDAQYDGKTSVGPWANMCEPCFSYYGLGLGTGVGQRLKLAEVKQ